MRRHQLGRPPRLAHFGMYVRQRQQCTDKSILEAFLSNGLFVDWSVFEHFSKPFSSCGHLVSDIIPPLLIRDERNVTRDGKPVPLSVFL